MRIKSKVKKWIIISFVVFIISIVLFSWNSDEQDLGDGYYYLPDYEAYDIGFPEGAVIYKSNQKLVFSDIKIPNEVIKVESNDQFIIAIRKLDNVDADDYSLQYFIIEKRLDSIYGPFNEENFKRKCRAIKLTKDLKFE